MATSTQTLDDGARLLGTVLTDTVQLLTVGEPVTVGFEVQRPVTPTGTPTPALVQATTLANAEESLVSNVYSVKFPASTVVEPGMVAEVVASHDAALVGKRLLLDKVNRNGLTMIVKAVASDWDAVDQQGKGNLS